MAESLNFVDLPIMGAAMGAMDYCFARQVGGRSELGYAFIYGADETLLTQQMDARKKRVDYAREHADKWAHPDGDLMTRREIIISVIQRSGLPMRIVGAEFYPPFEDAEVQEKEIGSLRSAMYAAHNRDLPKIESTLHALGIADQL